MRIISQGESLNVPCEPAVIRTKIRDVIYCKCSDATACVLGTYRTSRAAQVVLYKMACAYADGQQVFHMPPIGYGAHIYDEEVRDE
jgi:hypothetical protein